MTTLTLSVTFPDAQLPRVKAAAEAHYGTALTNAQLQAALKADVVAMVKSMVRKYEQKTALTNAEINLRSVMAGSTVTEVDVT